MEMEELLQLEKIRADYATAIGRMWSKHMSIIEKCQLHEHLDLHHFIPYDESTRMCECGCLSLHSMTRDERVIYKSKFMRFVKREFGVETYSAYLKFKNTHRRYEKKLQAIKANATLAIFPQRS